MKVPNIFVEFLKKKDIWLGCFTENCYHLLRLHELCLSVAGAGCQPDYGVPGHEAGGRGCSAEDERWLPHEESSLLFREDQVEQVPVPCSTSPSAWLVTASMLTALKTVRP